MTLTLEIEHLLGVAFAARAEAGEVPDWPPQPDRVFSALVASWGARGERAEERAALEWLEMQPAPEIAASDGFSRTAPIVFVPPNDAEGGRVGNAAVLPALRRRQARRFPAYRPDDPIMSLIWRQAMPDAATLGALNALAADTAYIGHSASFTRCRFHVAEPPGAGSLPRRRIYRGRFAELEQSFHARPPRRPSPGAPVGAVTAALGRVATSVFADRWLVLEHIGDAGAMPDIRAAPLVAKGLRNVIMSGYQEIGLGEAIPAEISGHSPDGRPSSEPHLAIAPLAFVASPYASGAVFGFALIPPRDRMLLTDRHFQRALGAITQWSGEEGRRELRIVGNGFDLTFATVVDSPKRSLDPAPYVAKAGARMWASCTPIVLDRHLKEAANEEREQEIACLLRRACTNIGLPEPYGIAAGKHSALEGSPSAYPSWRAPQWTRWRVPESLGRRQLIHAVIEFAEPVHGPVILGAGRFVGLGVFRAFGTPEARS
jgi:CRISPR-associated protein Csb2